MVYEVAEAGETDTFVINLRRDSGAFPLVSSVELVLPEMRNRYSFKPRKTLQDLFDVNFADRLEAALNRLTDSERLVLFPEFVYEIPGLIISGLRILVTVTEDGVETIILRIRHYIGAIKSVFQFDAAMSVSSSTTRERIAVDVLEDIIAPLFDLISLDVPGMDEIIEKHAPEIRKRMSQLSIRQEEIVFFTGLLQRYVAGCQHDAAIENRSETSNEDRKLLPKSA